VEAVPGVPAVGLAVLVGEPNQAGPYVIRVKVPQDWQSTRPRNATALLARTDEVIE